MAWGKSSTPKPPPSAAARLVPLIIFFLFVGIAGFVGYHIYLTVTAIADGTSKKLEKKNVVFTKDGMKVGVKELKNERYVDKTQGCVRSAVMRQMSCFVQMIAPQSNGLDLAHRHETLLTFSKQCPRQGMESEHLASL
jgi:hypothetical protein